MIALARVWPFTQMLIVDMVFLLPLHHAYEMMGLI